MTQYIVGIDPGLTGAMTFIDVDSGAATILDMPTRQKTVSGKKRREIDTQRLAERFDCTNLRMVILEEQSTRPGHGAQIILKTGFGYGLLVGVIAANFHPHEIVRPQTWKKSLDIPKDKDAARAKASQLMPAIAHYWSLKGQDGRAESALLALYGFKYLGVPIPPVRSA